MLMWSRTKARAGPRPPRGPRTVAAELGHGGVHVAGGVGDDHLRAAAAVAVVEDIQHVQRVARGTGDDLPAQPGGLVVYWCRDLIRGVHYSFVSPSTPGGDGARSAGVHVRIWQWIAIALSSSTGGGP